MIEDIITKEEYEKLVGNIYKPLLLNDYEINFILSCLEQKFSEKYDDRFVYLYNNRTI